MRLITVGIGVVLLVLGGEPCAAQLRFTPPEPPPETSQYDFLVGQWTFTAVWRLPGGEQRGGGSWTARRGLDGFALIDEWRLTSPESGETTFIGASTRIFNPKTDRWEWTFVDVYNARQEEQYAEWRDGEMHVWWDGVDPADRPYRMRVRYHDIGRDSFRWTGDRSYDGGRTWILGWLTMEVRRTRSPSPEE